MSTTVTFAGHLVDDPELLHTRESPPPAAQLWSPAQRKARKA